MLERRGDGKRVGAAGGRMRRIRQALPALLVCLASSSVQAQTVRGHLLERSEGDPVVLGHVALLDTSMVVVASTLSDHAGFFELVAPEPGDYWVVADRVGYDPVIDGVVELGDGGVLPVEIRMTMRVVELEGLSVTAHRRRIDAQLDNAGFWERAGRGFGKFVTPDDIAERPPINIPHLLRDIPDVRFRDSGMTGAVPFFKARGSGADRFDPGVPAGYCRPGIFVDGMQISTLPRHRATDQYGNNESPTESYLPVPIEEMVEVQDIVAVEVYSGGATVPFQWNSAEGSCGVILFWTDGGG